MSVKRRSEDLPIPTDWTMVRLRFAGSLREHHFGSGIMGFRRETGIAGTILVAAMVASCSANESTDANSADISADPFDVPISGATAAQVATFHDGDEEFGLPMREGDGLG